MMFGIIVLSNENIIHSEIGTNNLPSLFVDQLFELKQEEISLPSKLSYAKYAVAKINQSSKQSQEKIDPMLYERIENISNDNYKDTIYHQYINYLKTKYKVEINMNLLNRYYNQF